MNKSIISALLFVGAASFISHVSANEKGREDYHYVKKTCTNLVTGKQNYAMCSRYGYTYPTRAFVFQSNDGQEAQVEISQAKSGRHIFDSSIKSMTVQCNTTNCFGNLHYTLNDAYIGFATAVKNNTFSEKKKSGSNTSTVRTHITDVIKGVAINKISAAGSSSSAASQVKSMASNSHVIVIGENGLPLGIARINANGSVTMEITLLPENGNPNTVSYSGTISDGAFNAISESTSIFRTNRFLGNGGGSCETVVKFVSNNQIQILLRCTNN